MPETTFVRAAPPEYNPDFAMIPRLIFLLLPGTGHIHQDRHGRGLLFFFLFLFFLNAVAVAPWLPLPVRTPWIRLAGSLLAVFLWILAGYDYLREEARRRAAAPPAAARPAPPPSA